MNLTGRPSRRVGLLEANARELGLTQQGYIYYLLRERVRQMLEKKRKD